MERSNIEGQKKPGAEEIEAVMKAGWLEVISPGNQRLVKLLKQNLEILYDIHRGGGKVSGTKHSSLEQ